MADWWMRSGGGGGGQDPASEGGHLGVHVKYEELYDGMIFLALVWVTGQVASRVFRMPALVGEILMGILLGPSALHIVPFPQGWVLFGEIGCVVFVFLCFSRFSLSLSLLFFFFSFPFFLLFLFFYFLSSFVLVFSPSPSPSTQVGHACSRSRL